MSLPGRWTKPLARKDLRSYAGGHGEVGRAALLATISARCLGLGLTATAVERRIGGNRQSQRGDRTRLNRQ